MACPRPPAVVLLLAALVGLFNSGYSTVERQRTLLELDPVERSVIWSYRSPGFFSATEGTPQALSNGNLLATEVPKYERQQLEALGFVN